MIIKTYFGIEIRQGKKYHVNIPGLLRFECPTLLKPAKMDKNNNTVNPKKITAFKRTQTVCIIFLIFIYY